MRSSLWGSPGEPGGCLQLWSVGTANATGATAGRNVTSRLESTGQILSNPKEVPANPNVNHVTATYVHPTASVPEPFKANELCLISKIKHVL